MGMCRTVYYYGIMQNTLFWEHAEHNNDMEHAEHYITMEHAELYDTMEACRTLYHY